MSTNDFPVFDGICPSYADIGVTTSLSGSPLIDMADIKSISTGSSLEVGELIGASGGRVMKRTTGTGKYTAGMVLYRSGYQKFLRALAAVAPVRAGRQKRVALVHFQIKVAFTPPGDVEIYETIIRGCRFAGRDLNSAEGNDADTVDVKLNPLEIVDIIDGEEVVLL